MSEHVLSADDRKAIFNACRDFGDDDCDTNELLNAAYQLGIERGKAEREKSELCRNCGIRRLCGEDWELNKESPF